MRDREEKKKTYLKQLKKAIYITVVVGLEVEF